MKAASDIDSHNARKNETYKRGETDDSDMTYKEKQSKRMGLSPPEKKNRRSKREFTQRVKRADDPPLPNETDYRFEKCLLVPLNPN